MCRYCVQIEMWGSSWRDRSSFDRAATPLAANSSRIVVEWSSRGARLLACCGLAACFLIAEMREPLGAARRHGAPRLLLVAALSAEGGECGWGLLGLGLGRGSVWERLGTSGNIWERLGTSGSFARLSGSLSASCCRGRAGLVGQAPGTGCDAHA